MSFHSVLLLSENGLMIFSFNTVVFVTFSCYHEQFNQGILQSVAMCSFYAVTKLIIKHADH